MLTDNFLRGRRRRELSDDEKEAIEGVLTAPVTLPRRKVVTSRGDVVTRSTLKQYRDSTAVTGLKQFEGRGHSLTIDNGWKEVADSVLEWLHSNGL